jgi:hypothetical protein
MRRTDIADDVLVQHGALPGIRQGHYELSCVTTPADLSPS